MKCVLIADPHGNQEKIVMPEGELLIIAGDLTIFGTLGMLQQFASWLEKVVPNFKYGAVVIAGNHDIGLDPIFEPDLYKLNEQVIKAVPNVHYLNDSGITINNYKIWGSPITPEFCDWAFNRNRGTDILKHWNMIPLDTDILVTHGPPWGIKDQGLGCKDLTRRLDDLDLKLHVFGHIHPPYSLDKLNNTYFANAAVSEIVRGRYVLTNLPLVVDLPEQTGT